MKKLYLIGIGSGNPKHLTVEAVEVLKAIDVFFIFEKDRENSSEINKIRKEILNYYLNENSYRVVNLKVSKRKKGGDLQSYVQKVLNWRIKKAEALAEGINNHLRDGENGCLLIWGEPSIYDGHIEIVRYILNRGLSNFDYEIIPGISSFQVLAAKHKISLSSVGENIHLTTGRRLRQMDEKDIENTLVLLDNYHTYKKFSTSNLNIYWGCYLGLSDEIILSGKLRECLPEIERIRKKKREEKGWIMETYLLRKEDED